VPPNLLLLLLLLHLFGVSTNERRYRCNDLRTQLLAVLRLDLVFVVSVVAHLVVLLLLLLLIEERTIIVTIIYFLVFFSYIYVDVPRYAGSSVASRGRVSEGRLATSVTGSDVMILQLLMMLVVQGRRTRRLYLLIPR